jgi:hypothetical protein
MKVYKVKIDSCEYLINRTKGGLNIIHHGNCKNKQHGYK